MNHSTGRWWVAAAAAAMLASPAARAQWAVIDSASLTQLITEVQTLQEQLQTARGELTQAEQAFRSTTGPRGMQNLLGGTVRNYLPPDWLQIEALLQGAGGAYGALAAQVSAAMTANAVLPGARLATLFAAGREQIVAARQATALQQALTREALANASARFASLQALISAIPAAGDQKAVLDLQARMSAELAMLANEQTKVQALYQSTQAQDAANRLKEREASLAAQGQFGSRFQPVP